MRTTLRNRRTQQGQTLIIALLILGVLLILGAVFAGILSRTIKGTSLSKARGQANDFAESGIRYAHSQLLNSELGADWRGNPETIVETAPDFTRDPDIYYLRPGSPAFTFPGTTRYDLGGPDGLGPFFRVLYRGGRALVRVRYAPADDALFSGQTEGYLRNAGMVRNQLIIESVGRQGDVRPNDPSLAGTRGAVKYVNFSGQPELVTELARMREYDVKETTGRKLIAFAQIGLIDYARFVTNKHRVSRPFEFGFPTDSGTRYRESTAAPDGLPIDAPVQIGTSAVVRGLGAGSAAGAPTQVYANGAIRVNGDMRIYGNMVVNVNRSFGEGIFVSGAIGGERNSTLTLNHSSWDPTTSSWNNATVAPIIDSNNNAFSTFGGGIRDGFPGADANQDPRNVGYMTPATIMGSPSNGNASAVSRYVKMTRDSGSMVSAGYSGQYGHGEGVYVDNFSDYQTPVDEEGRRAAGGTASLVQDWLNPFGDGVTFRSGWHGPFYIPVGAFVHLTKDGFIVSRNVHPEQNVSERTWRNPAGADSGLSSIRYRIGYGTDGQLHVVNSLTAGLSAAINGVLNPADYDRGPIFNGTLYFEGNVRVRGVIPTDVQMTIVSGRTVYIEGSILKGVQENDVTSATPIAITGGRLNRPSKSSLMLMAKDYVALNPTMFFGPSNERNAQVERGGTGLGGYNPVKLGAPDGMTTLQYDIPLAATDPANPSTLLPTNLQTAAPLSYYEFDPANPNLATGTGARVNSNLLLTHALEYTNPGPSNTFIGMAVNPGNQIAGNQEYQFATLGSATNTAEVIWASISGGPVADFGPIYGLGAEGWQQSPKFETVQMPIVTPTSFTSNLAQNRITTTFGVNTPNNFELVLQETNSLEIALASLGTQAAGNYLLARATAVPMDVKIEASLYAEEGSFFVIPGDWFNPNPNDRRDTYNARVAALQTSGLTLVQAHAQASSERLRDFGSTAYAPFYGEPVDVKIDIVGSVAENMAPPISQQADWLRKWGWIPTKQAALVNPAGGPRHIPFSHVSEWTRANPAARLITPNITISYDPILATGRVNGYGDNTSLNDDTNPVIRTSTINGVTYALPPMPRLPVSPTLSFFGEVK